MSGTTNLSEPTLAPHKTGNCQGRVNWQAEDVEQVRELFPCPSTYRLRRRTPGSFVLVSCPQIGRALKCQGQLEAAAAVIFAGCPEVQSVCEQPVKIWYSWRETGSELDIQILKSPPQRERRRRASKNVSYVVPDFLVKLTNGRSYLVEVKPSRRLEDQIVKRKLSASRTYAAKNGWPFYVLTEQHLLRGTLVRNLRLLARYRHLQADPNELATLELRVPQDGRKLTDLLNAGASGAQVRVCLFHLLAIHRLSFDPRSLPLDKETMIYPGGAFTWNPFDSVWAPNGCSTGGPSV